MLVPGTVCPLPASGASLSASLRHDLCVKFRLTFAHLSNRLAGLVALLRLPAAHVVAVAQHVAHGAGGGLKAACGEEVLVDIADRAWQEMVVLM